MQAILHLLVEAGPAPGEPEPVPDREAEAEGVGDEHELQLHDDNPWWSWGGDGGMSVVSGKKKNMKNKKASGGDGAAAGGGAGLAGSLSVVQEHGSLALGGVIEDEVEGEDDLLGDVGGKQNESGRLGTAGARGAPAAQSSAASILTSCFGNFGLGEREGGLGGGASSSSGSGSGSASSASSSSSSSCAVATSEKWAAAPAAAGSGCGPPPMKKMKVEGKSKPITKTKPKPQVQTAGGKNSAPGAGAAPSAEWEKRVAEGEQAHQDYLARLPFEIKGDPGQSYDRLPLLVVRVSPDATADKSRKVLNTEITMARGADPVILDPNDMEALFDFDGTDDGANPYRAFKKPGIVYQDVVPEPLECEGGAMNVLNKVALAICFYF